MVKQLLAWQNRRNKLSSIAISSTLRLIRIQPGLSPGFCGEISRPNCLSMSEFKIRYKELASSAPSDCEQRFPCNLAQNSGYKTIRVPLLRFKNWFRWLLRYNASRDANAGQLLPTIVTNGFTCSCLVLSMNVRVMYSKWTLFSAKYRFILTQMSKQT